jgi:hypothetical protein
MKKIIGKLKNDQNVLVFDNAEVDGLKDVYKVPNVTLAIPFEVDTRKLAEGEWYYFVLTEEEKQEMLGGFVSEDTSVGLDTMVADYYAELKAIYLVSGEERLFTKVTPRQILRSQKYVSFGDKPALVEQGNAIRLTGEVDAYWNGSRLFFKKFTLIQSLFPGIKKMYRQVTEKGTNEFLSSSLFELKSEMSSEIIGLRNRRKMVSIIDSQTIDLKDAEVCNKYLEYAKSYNLDLEITDGKIALIDNTDIATVINLFGENFYTTPITDERREIRTSKKLVPNPRKRAR